MSTRTKSKDRRTRIANKLYETHIKQKVRLGEQNNVIQLYADSIGNIMRLSNDGRRLTSMDKQIQYLRFPPIIFMKPLLFENQHYQKHTKSKRVLYFTATQGQATIKKCTICGKLKELSEFNLRKTYCRDCQSNVKAEYRKRDSYHISNDRRLSRLKTESDRTVTRANVVKLYNKQNKECNYCKTHLPLCEMHKDHITPLIRGGKHSISNIQLLCPRCNLKKGKLTHEEYFDFLS